MSTIITANNWNNLISAIESAEKIGDIVPQGSGGSATHVNKNEVFKAQFYNEIARKLNAFEGVSIEQVQPQQFVTAAVINALKTGYQNANFKSSVCDVCNIGESDCICNCSCDCGCDCDCSCPCPCSCPGNEG